MGPPEDNKSSRQTALGVVAVLVIIGAGYWIFVQARDFGSSATGVYFTTDDGNTVFIDKNTKLAPFDKNGKPAYRAHVFECGGQRVVGYLSRYTEQSIKALEEAKAYRGTGKPPPNVHLLASIGTTGLEVKRPGDAKWVSQADVARATKIRAVKCPDGTVPQEVDPR